MKTIRILALLCSLILPHALHASATIQAVYYTVPELKVSKHSSQRVNNQFGEKFRLPKNGIMCSFTVANAQPHRDVILNFCVKEGNDLVTKWRLTLGGQRDINGSEPFTVFSSMEHLVPGTGTILEQHEVKHPAGTPFIQNGQRFHVLFKLVNNTLLVKVFDGQQSLMEKLFHNVPAQTHYMIPASGSSEITYNNIVLKRLPDAPPSGEPAAPQPV